MKLCVCVRARPRVRVVRGVCVQRARRPWRTVAQALQDATGALGRDHRCRAPADDALEGLDVQELAMNDDDGGGGHRGEHTQPPAYAQPHKHDFMKFLAPAWVARVAGA